jgi:hypothetical protein
MDGSNHATLINSCRHNNLNLDKQSTLACLIQGRIERNGAISFMLPCQRIQRDPKTATEMVSAVRKLEFESV